MQADMYTTQAESEIALLYRKYAPGICYTLEPCWMGTKKKRSQGGQMMKRFIRVVRLLRLPRLPRLLRLLVLLCVVTILLSALSLKTTEAEATTSKVFQNRFS